MDRLWAMQIFVRVVECGSFNRAAESLDIANATVTSSVRNLERHLGVTLISRNTRFLHLTDEGQAYLDRCRQVLSDVEQMETEVRGKNSEISGVLRVESPVAFARALLCPAMAAFTTRHPGISVAMTLTDHPQNLIERGTDVAIRIDYVDDADLVARPIYQARYVVCGTPQLAAALPHPDDPAQLDPRRCLGILASGRYMPREWVFSRDDRKVSLCPEGPVHYNNSEALIQAAQEGLGFVYVLDVFANSLIANGTLSEVFSDWETASRTFYAVAPHGRFVSPKARAFSDFLLESLDAQRRPLASTPVEVRSGRRGKSSH